MLGVPQRRRTRCCAPCATSSTPCALPTSRCETSFELPTYTPPPQPGIETLLRDLDPGEPRQVVIGFTNDTRTQEDTFKAIYRLSVVGAIDDYTVDYHTATVTAMVTRQPDASYVACLSRYLARICPPRRRRVP